MSSSEVHDKACRPMQPRVHRQHHRDISSKWDLWGNGLGGLRSKWKDKMTRERLNPISASYKWGRSVPSTETKDGDSWAWLRFLSMRCYKPLRFELHWIRIHLGVV